MKGSRKQSISGCSKGKTSEEAQLWRTGSRAVWALRGLWLRAEGTRGVFLIHRSRVLLKRLGSGWAGEMAQHLLCNPEDCTADLSIQPAHCSPRVGEAGTGTPGQAGSLEYLESGSCGFKWETLPQSIKWRVIKEDTGRWSLVSMFTCTCVHAHLQT